MLGALHFVKLFNLLNPYQTNFLDILKITNVIITNITVPVTLSCVSAGQTEVPQTTSTGHRMNRMTAAEVSSVYPCAHEEVSAGNPKLVLYSYHQYAITRI